MTTYSTRSSLTRTAQDGAERHIWGRLSYEAGAGAYLELQGTGTREYDVPVLNFGYGFNLPDNSNAEVVALADGADTNQKLALPTLPRDKQRQWKPNAGGVQNPLDGAKALEFNTERAFLRELRAAFGNGGILEIDGETVIIRGRLIVAKGAQIKEGLEVKGAIKAEGAIASGADVSAGGRGVFGSALSAGGNIDAGGSGAFSGLSSGGRAVKTESGGRQAAPAAPVSVSVRFEIPAFKDSYG